MTTQTQTRNPFKGKTKADNGGDFQTEIPSVDTHDARIVALIDLGTHNVQKYQAEGHEAKHQVYLVYELDEEMTGMKGVNHVVGVRYTLSFHEKATLRKLAETILNEGQKFPSDHDLDYTALLGTCCTVQISHKSGTGDKADRKYAVVGTISGVARKKREAIFRPKREVVSWFIGQPLDDLPDYLPRIYGETVEDVIRRCHELTGRSGEPDEGEGEVGSGSGAAEETPF